MYKKSNAPSKQITLMNYFDPFSCYLKVDHGFSLRLAITFCSKDPIGGMETNLTPEAHMDR